MSDSELLNRQLTALENGASLEQSLDQLPADERELRPLLNLAAQIRALEHPELSPGIASAQQRQVIEASRSLDRPVRRPEVPLDRRRWQGPVRVATIGFVLFIALFAVTVIVGSMVLGERRRLHQVTLEGVTGTVEVAEDGAWKPVDTGDRLTAGKRVRTGPDSSLTMAFFEGTRTTLGPDTEVTLTTIDGSADTLRLLLTQHAGKTSHIVVPLRGEDGFFVIDTPSGRAAVQGTVFDVMVSARGQAFFNVEQGRVKVSGAGHEVVLLAGQATAAAAGKRPEPAAYHFTIQGQIDDKSGTTWTATGVPIAVIDRTEISGDPQIGDSVVVIGRILDDGKWLADTIEPSQETNEIAAFTSVLKGIGDQSWRIGDLSVAVDDRTRVDGDLSLGDLVRLTFVADDGRWLAQEIDNLQENYTMLAMADSPELEGTPVPLNTGNCTYGKGYWKNHSEEWPDTKLTLGIVTYDQEELLDILRTSPRGDATYILASQLIAAKLNVLAGANTSVISATITAADAWLETYPPDRDPTGPDRQEGVHLAEILDDYNSGTIGPGSCDDLEPTDTSTVTPTVTITPTVTPTATVTPTTTVVVTDCTGANPHPHATTLAKQFNADYDDIMGWKCSGFGFGEIKHAYTLSRTEFTAADIFEMRLSGLGWGQIKKLLLDGDPELDGRSKGNPNKDDRDNPQGKKDKGDKEHGNKDDGNRGQGNNDRGDRDRANNGAANNGNGNRGKADLGPGIKDKGDKGRGNKNK
ncbi:MAG: DUF5666 domain-containing protein [Candidatus Promineifilaceae bacterium]